MFQRIFTSMKKHSWFWAIIITSGLGWLGVWVNGVNATGRDVVELKVVLPRIETNTDRIRDDVVEVKERVSRIEGYQRGKRDR